MSWWGRVAPAPSESYMGLFLIMVLPAQSLQCVGAGVWEQLLIACQTLRPTGTGSPIHHAAARGLGSGRLVT